MWQVQAWRVPSAKSADLGEDPVSFCAHSPNILRGFMAHYIAQLIRIPSKHRLVLTRISQEYNAAQKVTKGVRMHRQCITSTPS